MDATNGNDHNCDDEHEGHGASDDRVNRGLEESHLVVVLRLGTVVRLDEKGNYFVTGEINHIN